MTALLLTFILFMPNGQPQLAREGKDVMLYLPKEILEDAHFKRRLFSGLTTTIELETALKTAGEVQTHHCYITVRFEVWEERLLVQMVNARQEIAVNHFADLEGMAAWFLKTPMLIASIEEPNGLVKIRTKCRIIPFSQQEAGRTQAWFAGKLKTPAAGDRGSLTEARERNATGESEAQGIFEVLLTTGINAGAVRTYRWKWQLEGSN